MAGLTDARTLIGDLVKSSAVAIEPKATLRAVAKTLGHLGIGVVVVLDKGRVVGVVSERDLVWAIAQDADLDVVWAADVMTTDTATVTPTTPLLEAAATMMANNARHILVDHPEVPGVVSMRDIVGELVDT